MAPKEVRGEPGVASGRPPSQAEGAEWLRAGWTKGEWKRPGRESAGRFSGLWANAVPSVVRAGEKAGSGSWGISGFTFQQDPSGSGVEHGAKWGPADGLGGCWGRRWFR